MASKTVCCIEISKLSHYQQQTSEDNIQTADRTACSQASMHSRPRFLTTIGAIIIILQQLAATISAIIIILQQLAACT